MEPDDSWENVVGVPIPTGFRLYVAAPHDEISDWRQRFGDAIRDRLSLLATGDDMSGLAQVPAHRLWRLDVRGRRVTDDDFDLIAQFDQLEELDLTKTLITDAAAVGLHTLQQMRVLKLGRCSITDAAMVHLAALRRLEYLDLWKTGVTDEGLRSLAFHPKLCVLNLRDTQVTGERFAPLVTIPNLREVWLSRRQHRRAGRFEQERPGVRLCS